MSKILVAILLVVVSYSSFGTTKMAVIDSGTDMGHDIISPYSWINSGEIPGNNRDEDRNGYQDDIRGWNFAEDNNEIIDYSYLGLLNDDVRRFFAIQSRSFDGTVTEDDKTWMNEMRKDQDFIKSLTTYGNFMHGTHVAGIMVADASTNVEILAVKLIPTEVKLPGKKSIYHEVTSRGLGYKLIEAALGALAAQQSNMMGNIAAYIDGHGVTVANGSFGTGYNQATQIVAMLYKTLLFKDPTAADLDKLTRHFLDTMIDTGRDNFVSAAPDTLFVFAAGNDGSNNDKYPSSPTNIDSDNVISVAATYGRERLASFSNFGIATVDVAAPGVSIHSSVPGNKFLRVSGTSQAAPYVANVAARVKDINSSLTPKEIKKILMGTVDYKPFLEEAVKSRGIVNVDRALHAATLSLSGSVNSAIIEAFEKVEDLVELRFEFDIPVVGDSEYILPLPSTFRY